MNLGLLPVTEYFYSVILQKQNIREFFPPLAFLICRLIVILLTYCKYIKMVINGSNKQLILHYNCIFFTGLIIERYSIGLY